MYMKEREREKERKREIAGRKKIIESPLQHHGKAK
jgi:hypothetical protein